MVEWAECGMRVPGHAAERSLAGHWTELRLRPPRMGNAAHVVDVRRRQA